MSGPEADNGWKNSGCRLSGPEASNMGRGRTQGSSRSSKMAVGGAILGRTVSSFPVSGELYQSEQAIVHDRRDRLRARVKSRWGSSTLNGIHVQGDYFSQNARLPRSPFHSTCPDQITINRTHLWKMELPRYMFSGRCVGKKNFSSYVVRRISGKCQCFLASDPPTSCLVQPRKLNNLGISDGQCQLLKYRLAIRTRADFKSEQYDITGSSMESLPMESLDSSEVLNEPALLKEDVQDMPNWWEQFPKRWVNMSIAILPMSAEFNWNPATVGLIQSSFFWGYLLTQILGGIWADKIGGKLVLGFGVVWWSAATVLTPIAAKIGLPFLLITRAFMGIGEGVAMPAMNNILSKWIPVSERSRSLAFVYSGMYLGSVTGLALSPILIHKFGWPSVFFAFGSLGSIWFALWQRKAYSTPKEDPGLCADEKALILNSSVSKDPVSTIPWKLILSKAPKPPSDHRHSAALIMQSIGFLGPAFFLTQLSRVRTPALAVLCMACSQGTDAFSQSGLYSNHQDIGPRYAIDHLPEDFGDES
ncbi:hypothetical protein QJS10_CPB18g01608 [Acorus calamus]|uniref:Major facilitator superfamily (MFS) profile domain-containing protein n=1 Tax=Acorus calamus TaxID=4465 RepID=A0AAV9CK98_ACOCL|nr:hypothetical protein QJS10_CPB18g01608 [Acorus calamus]